MVTEINIQKVREDAEKLYAEGSYYCSEAIVSSIRDNFDADIPVEAIAMASGFPVGIGGSKCVCGAVSGGVMCLGYFFGRTNPKNEKVKKAMDLAHELHDYFRTNHEVLCCEVLTKGMVMGSENHLIQCISFTGEIAKKTAEIIARELDIKIIYD